MQLKARSHLYVRWIFLRILSFCFFAAFLSIAVQIVGLYGERGIIPLAPLYSAVQERLGPDSFINFPSLFWLNTSDSFMQGTCFLAAALSLVAFCGYLSGPILAVLWFLYLSIVSLGQEFMSFQWDSLLLETAFLGIWFAPWGFREISPLDRKSFESQKEVSYVFLWLLRLLCFKLMLFSGLCKLASGDTSWRDLSAMVYHYQSQPLPTPLSWLAQKLPQLIQKFTTFVVFVIEFVLPLALITCSRKARVLACGGFILLMIFIMFTGNYAFFNWLTIGLSITLLDDDAIFSVLPRSLKITRRAWLRPWSKLLYNSVISFIPGLLIGTCSLSYLWLMTDSYRSAESLPEILQIPLILSKPLRSFSNYGLFAVMTKSRPEIIIEGSNDAKTWLPYEFKFKPGDLRRAPPIVAPHQPRLDWQMWFAALGPARESPWFDNFAKRLLEGSPDTLALMDKNPFPDKPPREIRAILYDYQFSDLNTLLSKGEWWRRKETGVFYPETTLQDLVKVDP